MFEIAGNLHISLTNLSSIHGLPDNTIHLTSAISSPSIVLHTPYSELSTFHVILHSHSPNPPPAIYELGTEIFFTGQLASGPVGSPPIITVKNGRWGLHRGRDFDLAEEFHKARVWGSGYVVGVNLDPYYSRRSFLTVLDQSPKKVSSLGQNLEGL